jgi:hypothetical protein
MIKWIKANSENIKKDLLVPFDWELDFAIKPNQYGECQQRLHKSIVEKYVFLTESKVMLHIDYNCHTEIIGRYHFDDGEYYDVIDKVNHTTLKDGKLEFTLIDCYAREDVLYYAERTHYNDVLSNLSMQLMPNGFSIRNIQLYASLYGEDIIKQESTHYDY